MSTPAAPNRDALDTLLQWADCAYDANGCRIYTDEEIVAGKALLAAIRAERERLRILVGEMADFMESDEDDYDAAHEYLCVLASLINRARAALSSPAAAERSGET